MPKTSAILPTEFVLCQTVAASREPGKFQAYISRQLVRRRWRGPSAALIASRLLSTTAYGSNLERVSLAVTLPISDGDGDVASL